MLEEPPAPVHPLIQIGQPQSHSAGRGKKHVTIEAQA